MRFFPLVLLAACADPGTHLEVDADLQATDCDGQPCTHVDIELFHVDDVGNTTMTGESTVAISVDGEPAVDVPFVDHSHTLELRGWVRHVRIDIVVDGETKTIESDNRLSSPYEAQPELPATVAVGSTPHLTWRAQGNPVEVAILFSTKVPATRFGFLESFGEDTGDFEIGPGIFTAPGDYNIALYRSASHQGVRWGSNWQQRVTAIIDPK